MSSRGYCYYVYPFRILENGELEGYEKLRGIIQSKYIMNDNNIRGLQWAFREIQRQIEAHIWYEENIKRPYDNTNKRTPMPDDVFQADVMVFEKVPLWPDYIEQKTFVITKEIFESR
jgi:hypothetical protein